MREIGLRDADDGEIWSYAARHGYVIITKDADFRQRSFLFGHPPKVVWLRLGNCSTDSIEAILRRRAADIEEFLVDERKALLGLS